jgi:hypothetical protein
MSLDVASGSVGRKAPQGTEWNYVFRRAMAFILQGFFLHKAELSGFIALKISNCHY